ncbi:MAG: cytochrome d ubiquinol oxidase subunit II [Anaerolineae bacterium]|nr:cytochrome d ubiquinol oxidase subunit II [Anaerolineae bacterium]
MELYDLWFVLISILFIGFFFLEGFDYGVGILLPFLGKNDRERRAVINTIGPHWDGNEVWMITAGGAIFAAFPEWYATLFSGFYLALVLMLFALIVRGVSFEFRSKEDDPRWRAVFDWGIFFGSAIPALLWGVAFGNLIDGTPINAAFDFTGNFFDLLSPYTLICGVAGFAVFVLHGAIFLALKSDGVIRERAEALAWRAWPVVTVIAVVLAIANYAYIDIFDTIGVNPGIMPVASAAAILAVGYFIREKQFGWAFVLMGLTILLSVATFFWFLHPNVMVSSTDAANSLTVETASASKSTLELMTVVALVFVPVVLLYQGWSYWVFRKRITPDSHLEY